MKLFKNRGDIYFSKINTKQNKEQRILLICLGIIVFLSLIAVIVTGAKNDFSAKKFFAPDETQLVAATDETITEDLPQVSGKTNYLMLVTGSDEQTVYLSSVIQFDMDSVSYKICNLMPSTNVDGNTLADIYKKSGISSTLSAVQKTFGIDIDYYIVMTNENFEKFFDDLGDVSYPILNDIKYKNTQKSDPYSLRIKSGEQTLDAKKYLSLLRYYVDEKSDCSTCNDIALYGLNQQFNEENSAKKEELFRSFIALAKTNLTVKDFSKKTENISVLCSPNVGVNTYNVKINYSKTSIDSSSISSMKSYFAH